MSCEAQVPVLPLPRPPSKFSRYRSVRNARGSDPTSSPNILPATENASQNVPNTRLPSRYHRKLKSIDYAVETLADQPAHPAPPLYSHSASLAALTGEQHLSSRLQDAQNTPSKTAPRDEVLPSVSARIKSITRPTRRSNPNATMVSHKANQAPASVATDSAISRVGTSRGEIERSALLKSRAKTEQMREVGEGEQTAARAFGTSTRMALSDKPQSEDHILGNTANIEDAVTPKLHNRRAVVTSNFDVSSQGPMREEAKLMSPVNLRHLQSDYNVVNGSQNGIGQGKYKAEAMNLPVQDLSSRHKFSHPRPPPLEHRRNPPSETFPIRSSSLPNKFPEPDSIASDIPRSAVNAGERSVVVKYNESVITLPVTPTTTPSALLHSVSTSMPMLLDPSHCVLSESFTWLGLERPLRMYEHVRDVMNSWDDDAQNHLTVLATSPNVLSKGDLDPRALPKQPVSTSLYMYHSQKPGKWDKRWVSLKQDGQICISKREDGSESFNICHLSDFDIYRPTHRQMKKLRPPKKICFAIKSQQKAAIFLDGANFVHFFATTDGPLTETWYSAVRTWRSWYLVNVLGEGQEQGSSQVPSEARAVSLRPVSSGAKTQNQLVSPKREQPAKPGMPTAISPPKVRPSPPQSNATHRREAYEVSIRGRSAPPSSFHHYQIQQPDGIPSPVPRRAPSVVRGGERTGSIRSSIEAPSSLRRSTSLSRAGSVTKGPKPLVDLTPQFQEQPQYLRKGHGIAPIPGRPLVEFATDVEALPGAIIVPPARAWQRPPDTLLGARADDAMSVKTSGRFPGPPNDEMAFTGTGLLGGAKSKRAQGGIGHGYGVKTGDRNHVGEPLVDLKIESQFADGSLLRQFETFQGENERGLIVDRAKRMERDVKVGEGF